MPAAHAIAPLLGPIAAKTTSAPAAPATGNAFGQVFRSVWDAASGAAAAAAQTDGAQTDGAQTDGARIDGAQTDDALADGAHGPSAQAAPDPQAATVAAAAADQVAPAPATLTGRPASTTPLAGRRPHPAKEDSGGTVPRSMVPLDAEPNAVTSRPSAMSAPEAIAVLATVSSQVAAPGAVPMPLAAEPTPANSNQGIPLLEAASAPAAILTTGPGTPSHNIAPRRTVAAAKGLDIDGTLPPGAMPGQVASLPAHAATLAAQAAVPPQADAPAQVAVMANGLDSGGSTPPGVVPSRAIAPATAPDPKAKQQQAALSAAAPSTPAAEPTSGAGPPGPAAPNQAPAHPAGGTTATDSLAATGPDPSAAAAANSLAGRGGISPDGNAPSQSERPHAGSPSQQTAPAPPLPPAATDIADSAPAAPATDHKITLRAVEADPASSPSVAMPDALLEQVAPTGPPALEPITSSVTATPQTHLASPAEQVAPAVLTLAKTADGGRQMTVRLQPADLGMVQVRIAQAVSGTTNIDITAENPATLLALQRDQPQLHRTLDEAGIPAAGRTVTFHVAEAAVGNGPGTGHAGSHQGSANRNSSAATDADGSAGGGRGSYRASERNTYPTARRRPAPPATAGPQAATAAQSYRIGLDITA